MMSELKFGKIPSKPDPRDWKWSDFRSGLKKAGLLPTTIPTTFGHGNTYRDWRMLGNGPDPTAPGAAQNGAGDCVWASADNETKIALTDASYTPEVVTEVDKLFDGSTAIKDYADATGYDPTTGANDNGTEIRAALKYRQDTGIIDTLGNRHKIGPYVSIEPGNTEHLLEAIYFFEGLPIGLEVAAAQMDQFEKGETTGTTPVWSYVKGSEIEGGHCIPMVGRPDTRHIAAITWRLKIFLTKPLITHQVDEVWAYATQERISKVTGLTRENASQEQLEEYLNLVGKAIAIA